MLPCDGCAYRAEVPGNAHIACEYAWRAGDPIPRGHPHGVRMGWFYFPVLFDPTWGPETCAGRSETRDPARTADAHGSAAIMARQLLG